MTDIKIFALFLLGIGILAGLVVVDAIAFSVLFDADYFEWYLQNGSLIGLLAVLSAKLIPGADKNIGLISANPFRYIGTHMKLAGQSVFMTGYFTEHIGKSSKYMGERMQRGAELSTAHSLGVLGELVLAIFGGLLLFVGAIAWLAFIAPLQYFVFLLCGALPRYVSRIQIDDQPEAAQGDVDPGKEPAKDRIGLSAYIRHAQEQAVSLTSAIAAMVLFFVKAIVIE